MNPDQRRQWMRVVLGHAQLTAAQKTVLIALETYADYRDGTDAYPGEENLAKLCGLKPRAVRYALDQGRQLGLIERTAPANHRAGRADVYRLVPTAETVAADDRITGTAMPVVEGVTGTTMPVNKPITGTAMPVDSPITGTTVPVNKVITGTAVHDHRHGHNSFTGTAMPPTLPTPSKHHSPGGLRNGGTSPAARLAIAHTPDRPSRFCDAHPIGTRDKCPDCANAREHQKAWDAEAAAIDVALAAATDFERRRRQQIIDACPRRCAENHGRVKIVIDGVETLAPCDHGLPKVAGDG